VTIVTPELWYRAYWTVMGVAFLVALFFVIKAAIVSAALWLRRHP